MRNSIQTITNVRAEETRQGSLYRRLAASRLPVNLYSAQAQMQRTAAALLHGLRPGSGSWEELDGRQLADDVRGDRTALFLAGATGGVAHTSPRAKGLLAAAGTGTLFLTHIEKLSPAAQRVLSSILASERYTPVGDPYPRAICCRIIVATREPLLRWINDLPVEWRLADILGRVALCAEEVVSCLKVEEFKPERIYDTHPSTLAAAS
jgi:transcriptional regulator of acetoin/glycerol metabolism